MASSKSSSGKEQINYFPYIRFILSLLFILVGAFFLFWAVYSRFDFRIRIDETKVSSQQEPQVKPVKIYIPKLGRVLYVFEGEAEGNRWVTSPIGVSYLTGSAVPGNLGNSVIYGHNTVGILGGLWRVQEGDDIYVVMGDGNFYKYRVFERKEIAPTQVEILEQSADSRLTVYTCSGFLDSARFAVISRLEVS